MQQYVSEGVSKMSSNAAEQAKERARKKALQTFLDEHELGSFHVVLTGNKGELAGAVVPPACLFMIN
jgi:hypothetical protein